MSSVSQRVSEVKQPRGGYVRAAQFRADPRSDEVELSPGENIHPSIVGIVVKGLSRVMLGTPEREAFMSCIYGAYEAEQLGMYKALDCAGDYMAGIDKLTDFSIINACKLATFDVWTKNQVSAHLSKGADETNPDAKTIENIRVMVNRTVSFLTDYGPVLVEGVPFGGGYTDVVSTGEGDFLTFDTIWDVRVLKVKPTSHHTLQMLMYYIMGKHSQCCEFDHVDKVGIFNPRLNVVYTLNMSEVAPDIIKAIENDVICYDD